MRAPIPTLPSRNMRNKKTRNPGYIGGAHWVICDRCGCAVRECDSRLTWEGYVVCPDDWEPRHPQDFVRAREDRIAPEGNNRPESSDAFVNPFCVSHTDIIDDAVIDCLIIDGELQIPQSTFNLSTL